MPVLWIYALVSVTFVSFLSLLGIIALTVRKEFVENATFALVSLAVGAMLGDAFIHLLPEAFHDTDSPVKVSCLVMAGILGFFVLEKFLRWRHCHAPEAEEEHHVHSFGTLSLVADALENTVDGLVIGSSYLLSLEIGLAVTLAVVLHEIPNELGKFGVLLHAGFSRGKALLFNCLSSTLAIIGCVAALTLGSAIQSIPHAIGPIAAGAFIYLAGSDLVPELHKECRPSRSVIQLLCICVGVALMLALKLLD